MNAGGRIALERTEQGLTQKQLADLVVARGGKITQTGIDKLEKRDTARPRYVREIALSLNVTEEWLIHSKQPKYRNTSGEIRDVVNDLRALDPHDQNMILASLRAQIEVVKQRGTLLSLVQGPNNKNLQKR